MSIRGGLYIVDAIKWDESLASLEQPAILARFEISSGWILGRPRWPTVSDRANWLKATQATEVPAEELDDQRRERIAQHDLM